MIPVGCRALDSPSGDVSDFFGRLPSCPRRTRSDVGGVNAGAPAPQRVKGNLSRYGWAAQFSVLQFAFPPEARVLALNMLVSHTSPLGAVAKVGLGSGVAAA